MARYTKAELVSMGIERSKVRGRERLFGADEIVPGVYGNWFLSDGQLMLARRHTTTTLVKMKRGIPAGALAFNTREQAQQEAEWLHRQGYWPLWVTNAKPIYLIWR